eukprot:243083-Prorocentrum_minimum.AAC.1
MTRMMPPERELIAQRGRENIPDAGTNRSLCGRAAGSDHRTLDVTPGKLLGYSVDAKGYRVWTLRAIMWMLRATWWTLRAIVWMLRETSLAPIQTTPLPSARGRHHADTTGDGDTTGVVHADPHEGNIMLDKEGRLVYLDFGLMTYVDNTVMEAFGSGVHALSSPVASTL